MGWNNRLKQITSDPYIAEEDDFNECPITQKVKEWYAKH